MPALYRFCVRADLWATLMHVGIRTLGIKTTGICEGYHSSTKGLERALGGESRRLDFLLHFLMKHSGTGLTHRAVAAELGACLVRPIAMLMVVRRGSARCNVRCLLRRVCSFSAHLVLLGCARMI